MSYSGYAADCFNAVAAVIEAAAVAGSISVKPELVFEAGQPSGGLETPNVLVALPTAPYESDSWGGTGNLVNGQFMVDVCVNDQLTLEQTAPGMHPYGDATTPGVLTVTSQVENVLDLAYATLKAANSRVVDVQHMTTAFTRKTDASQVTAIVRIFFKIRFFAGDR